MKLRLPSSVYSVVLDLDGVLFDTKLAVTEAYQRAGVAEDKIKWGKPWWEWCDRDTHDVKCLHYFECVHLVRSMPLLGFAQRTNSPIITGASEHAVAALIRHFKLCGPGDRINVVGCELSLDEKIAWLQKYHKSQEETVGAYVDDDDRNYNRIREETAWLPIHPSACLLSFSQRVPASD